MSDLSLTHDLHMTFALNDRDLLTLTSTVQSANDDRIQPIIET